MKYVLLLGRILFSSIFIIKSCNHFCPSTISHAASMGVPIPSILVPFSGVLAFLGGVSILLGYKARIGAWLLVIFLIPTTFVMHKFWDGHQGIVAILHHFCFMKNLSMLGAVLMVAYFGSGPMSLSKDITSKKKK